MAMSKILLDLAYRVPEQNVVGLEVSVHDVLLVHGLRGEQQVLHEQLDLEFGALRHVLHLLQQLALGQQLEHQVQRVLRLVHLVEAQQVPVVQLPHDADLVQQRLLQLAQPSRSPPSAGTPC